MTGGKEKAAKDFKEDLERVKKTQKDLKSLKISTLPWLLSSENVWLDFSNMELLWDSVQHCSDNELPEACDHLLETIRGYGLFAARPELREV